MEQNKFQPLVSIVIPCYNHEKYVQECIKSVVAQDYQNIELIIIDDGSKDKSVSKIQELVPECENRFSRFEFRSRPNKGLSATLNEAVDWCEGQFYSAIASDDIMLPQKTSIQVEKLLARADCAAVCGGTIKIDENGVQLGVNKQRKEREYNHLDMLYRRYNVPAPTLMIRMEVIHLIGGYNEKIIFEDAYFLWKSTKMGFSILCLPDILCMYRRHHNNQSADAMLMIRGRRQINDLFNGCLTNKKSIAISNILDAIDYLAVDPKKSRKLYTSAIRLYPKVFFSKKSIKYLSRSLKINRKYKAG